MKKSIGVVIGANRDAVHTIKKAQKHGIYVVALDGNPNAEGFAVADEAVHVDISDQKKTCEEVERIKPDFVIPVPIGRILSTTGYINNKYGLKGIKYNATEMSTDKYLFHNSLKKSGLRPVELCLINRDTKPENVSVPYPAILKPRYGSGSRDVYYITNDSEWKSAYTKVLALEEDFILEEAASGTEYSVDGAVIHGKVMITLLRKKIITPLPVRQPVSSFSVVKNQENRELLKRVQEYVEQVVHALQYDDCLYNIDLIINNSQVFVIEAAPRPSGHNLHNVFVPCATGIDIAEEYVKFLIGEDFTFETEEIRCVQIRFFDFNEVRIIKVPEQQELVNSGKCSLIQWECSIKNGQYMDRVVNGHSIMGRGFFIVEGKDEQDLIKQSEWILSQFEYERL